MPSSPDLCPTCGQSIRERSLNPVGKRICSTCNKKIGRFHKWRFGPDGRPQHKNCLLPTGAPVPGTMDLPL